MTLSNNEQQALEAVLARARMPAVRAPPLDVDEPDRRLALDPHRALAELGTDSANVRGIHDHDLWGLDLRFRRRSIPERDQLSELTTLKVIRASKRSPGASILCPVTAGGAERLIAFGMWLTGSTQTKSLSGGL